MAKRRRTRRGRWLERLALGTIMSVVAFVVERRLMRTLRRRGEEPAAPERPAADNSVDLGE